MAMKSNNVDYSTVKEDFNIYEIENGQILKVKNGLVEIKNIEKDGKVGSQFAIKTVSHVITPTPLDTSGMELSTLEAVTDEHIVKQLKFKLVKQATCIYETEKFVLISETELIDVFLTNKKVRDGEPILRLKSNSEIGLFPKMSYMKTLSPEERKQYESQIERPETESPA
jgi:hypothetical protein